MAVIPRLLAPDGVHASLRDLAAAAGVSVPTVRHYFGDRGGLVAAAVETMGNMGTAHIARAADTEAGPVAASLGWLLRAVADAWTRWGVGNMVAASVACGVFDAQVGPATVNGILEPVLQAAERRIQRHVDRGEIVVPDVRAAALQLMAPPLLALLHQGPLGGAGCRPLDVDAFLDGHLAAWLRSYPPVSA